MAIYKPTIKTPAPQPSFWEKVKGVGKAIIDAPIKLGQDIFQFLPEAQEAKESYKSYQDTKNDIRKLANKFIPTDPKRIKLEKILADTSIDKEFQDLPNRNGRQMLGDLVESALFVAPFPVFKALKALPFAGKILASSLSGAVGMGAFGAAESIREEEASAQKTLKETALGAAGGAILGPATLGATSILGKLAKTGLKGIAQGGQAIERTLEKIPAYRNLILPIQTRLEQFYGDEGKMLAKKLLTIDENAIARTGVYTQKLDNAGFYKMIPEERINFVKMAEGKETKAVSDRVQNSFDVFKEMREEIGEEATEKGVMVKLRRGTEVPFKAQENYYPRDILKPELFANKNFRQETLQTAVDFGYFKDVDEAGKVLDGWLEAGAKEGLTGKENAFVDYLVKSGQTSTKLAPEEMKLLDKTAAKIAPVASEAQTRLMQQYSAHKNKAEEALANIWAELDNATAGQRIMAQEATQQAEAKFLAQESTFPKWLSAEYRTAEIVNELKNAIPQTLDEGIKYPANKKAAGAFDDMLKYLDEKLGIDTSTLRKAEMRTSELTTMTGKESAKKVKEAREEAAGMVSRFWKKSTLPKSGHLEKAREFNFPFYDTDPRRVITKWMFDSASRLETIEQFGLKGKELTKLIGKISKKMGSATAKEASQLIKVSTGAIERSPVAEKASLFLRTLSVPKLAFSQIINLGQSLNALLATDTLSFTKGIISVFTKAGRAEALKSGATLQQVIGEISRGVAGKEYDFAGAFLKYNGFQLTEKINRIVSANAGMAWTKSNFKALLKNPLNKTAKARLEELGINTEIAVARGELLEEELLKAGKRISDLTQFRARPLDLPAWTNGDMYKVAFQFKTFAYNQTRFLKNQLVKELNSNSPLRIARFLLIMGAVFPMGGEVIRDIRSLVTQEKRPTEALDRYLQDLVSIGGFGILSDLYSSATYGRLAETLMGPTAGSFAQTTEATVQTLQRYFQTGSLEKAFTPGRTRQIVSPAGPMVTYPMKYFWPSKNQPEDQQSSIDSLLQMVDDIKWKMNQGQQVEIKPRYK